VKKSYILTKTQQHTVARILAIITLHTISAFYYFKNICFRY